MKHLYAMVCFALLVATLAPQPLQAQTAEKMTQQVIPTLWIEEMTSPEIRMAIDQGYTHIIIPTAGIEQNGAHLPLNKHRLVVRENAMVIAQRLGNTLIAPIIDFVPEGNIETQEGHMYFAGTISMPRKVFADIIDYTIRSLHSHGFEQMYIIGDSGGNQLAQEMVAKNLRNDKINAYHIGSYYANEQQEAALKKHGFDRKAIGGHAGLRDTAEFMAVASHQVRRNKLENLPEEDLQIHGTWGDATKANPALGKLLLEIKVNAAVTEICKLAQKKPGLCNAQKR